MADSSQATLYLASALTTVKYVEGKMDIGASNKFRPGLLAAAMCVGWGGSPGKMRQDVDKDLEKVPGGGENWEQRIQIEAQNAKSWGCGNCGEQASIAFVHLRDNGIRPLDYYYTDDYKHAFVVVGRNSGTDKSDFTKWNAEAVICDPWRGVANHVTAEKSYLSGKTLTLTYRVEK